VADVCEQRPASFAIWNWRDPGGEDRENAIRLPAKVARAGYLAGRGLRRDPMQTFKRPLALRFLQRAGLLARFSEAQGGRRFETPVCPPAFGRRSCCAAPALRAAGAFSGMNPAPETAGRPAGRVCCGYRRRHPDPPPGWRQNIRQAICCSNGFTGTGRNVQPLFCSAGHLVRRGFARKKASPEILEVPVPHPRPDPRGGRTRAALRLTLWKAFGLGGHRACLTQTTVRARVCNDRGADSADDFEGWRRARGPDGPTEFPKPAFPEVARKAQRRVRGPSARVVLGTGRDRQHRSIRRETLSCSGFV